MTDEFENRLADYVRRELMAEEEARMTEYLRLNPHKQKIAGDFGELLGLTKQIAMDDPPDGLIAEGRQSVLSELRAIERRAADRGQLRLLTLQLQGCSGHGELCLEAELHSDLPGIDHLAFGARGKSLELGSRGKLPEEIGQVPFLKLQIQGSWGHGEDCVPGGAGSPRF
jgi:hypothetical protein